MHEKYEDPENVTELLKELHTLENMGDISDFISHVYPDWIVTVMKTFCSDYPQLSRNWAKICKDLNVPKAQILIVEEVFSDTEYHSLISHLCELFTRAGFVVRRKREYIPCTRCNNAAIPSQITYKTMKEMNVPVPDMWHDTCKQCRCSMN